MKKTKTKQECEFDYPSKVAKITENIRDITAEIAKELKQKDIFSVTEYGFEEQSDDCPQIVISVSDIRNSISIKGRPDSYLFSTDEAFKKELMFCLKFASSVNENATEDIYRSMDYSPLDHTFICKMCCQGSGCRGTYLEVKFDPYDDPLFGEVEYGYILPGELQYQDNKYRTDATFCALLPIIETNIIPQLVKNTQPIGVMLFDTNKTSINYSNKWLSAQLILHDVCVEACTVLLLALENMDVKSSNVVCYRDMIMCYEGQNTKYTHPDHNAIVSFKLAYGDTEVFEVLIFQKGHEKQLLITDNWYNKLALNLSGVCNYHQLVEMVTNFIRR